MPASRLGGQVAEVVASLESINAPFALIGGLALASHSVVRATQIVDLLVAAEDADREYFRLFDRDALLDEILQTLD